MGNYFSKFDSSVWNDSTDLNDSSVWNDSTDLNDSSVWNDSTDLNDSSIWIEMIVQDIVFIDNIIALNKNRTIVCTNSLVKDKYNIALSILPDPYFTGINAIKIHTCWKLDEPAPNLEIFSKSNPTVKMLKLESGLWFPLLHPNGEHVTKNLNKSEYGLPLDYLIENNTLHETYMVAFSILSNPYGDDVNEIKIHTCWNIDEPRPNIEIFYQLNSTVEILVIKSGLWTPIRLSGYQIFDQLVDDQIKINKSAKYLHYYYQEHSNEDKDYYLSEFNKLNNVK
jgi:hypothetical protein